jgi:ABC-2 type transport system ATP-binding protein
VLVSSHVLTEMAQLADEAIVISRGRLVRQAPIHELTSDSRELVVVTPEAGRLAAALHERGLAVESKDDGELHVTGADAARVGMIAFETGVPVLGLAEKESSLEDAFLELTEEDAR